uniref:Uncharacterized protein n=1 Tax=Arundo donax TaxID=35708 RepID=A0A0A9CRW0_ARUDO
MIRRVRTNGNTYQTLCATVDSISIQRTSECCAILPLTIFKYQIHISQRTVPFSSIVCWGFLLQFSCREDPSLLEVSSKVKFPRELLPG